MQTIYVIDRANQLLSYGYPTKDEADDAYDRFEAAGFDVYTDRIKAVLAKDAYHFRMRAQ